MEWTAKWIKPVTEPIDAAPVFCKKFNLTAPISNAKLFITSMGVYDASINGQRVGEYIMAPGWTVYEKRLQYQEYDIADLLQAENTIQVTVGKGWYRSPLGWTEELHQRARKTPSGLIAELHITYQNGDVSRIATDASWSVSEGPVRFAELYDGEIYDANITPDNPEPTEIFDGPSHALIPQQGEEIRKQETLNAARIFTTPKGELVIDFGQEITGYIKTTLTASKGDVVDLSFAEVMDCEGNFYTENYRTAKAQYHYICKDGFQTFEPTLTFWGFRYVRVNEFPGGLTSVSLQTFSAIVLHSDMKRTGYLSCSNTRLNKLFENVIWGQKGNFLDIPTDCPQRDERMGWTGDAQVFVKTATYNYDVERFFTKWLADLAADQWENGYVAHVVPDYLKHPMSSSAWGDAATICPWQIYLTYGNPSILEQQFHSMCKWVDYMTEVTTTPYLWTGGYKHYGDWLGLDAPSGSYQGSSREDFIASAFYAYSTSLVIKAGNALGKDVTNYENLYTNIVNAFRKTYPVYYTQTECVLAIHFGLAEDLQAAAQQLAELVTEAGIQLRTGFVGTPYLLHALSSYGYTDLAYSLLLREEYPSWLYPVTKGATTIWEHWDGIMEDGGFWSSDMNSYNHYAYGAVADWVYSVAAGITPVETAPGFAKAKIAPTPDTRLSWLKADFDTRHGRISSKWEKADTLWRYDITTPVDTEIIIDGTVHQVKAGSYVFYSEIK